MFLYGIHGASGFGREVMPVARLSLANSKGTEIELVFIDDAVAGARQVNGRKVMTYADFLKAEARGRFVSIGIADSQTREKLAGRCRADGVESFSIAAPNSLIMDENQIGEGAIICPFVTITSNTKIGRYFHANIYSYVAHDCVIGDFVTFAPAVKCNGNVVVEDHVYIGTGAILRQGKSGEPLVIGKGAVIGMGAVVTKSVPAGATVIGNPAKPMAK